MTSEGSGDRMRSETAKEHGEACAPCSKVVAGFPAYYSVASVCEAGEEAEVGMELRSIATACFEGNALH